MNDNKVVTVEKKATNKLGILVLIVVVMAVLGFGAYYLITNKSVISLDFNLPWQKEKEKEEEEVEEETVIIDGEKISKKSKSEKKLERQPVELDLNNSFLEDEGVELKVIKNDYKEGAYILKLKMSNTGTMDSVLKVKAISVDGCQFSQTFTMQTSPGTETTYDLVLPAQELDKNRIGTFSEIIFISDFTIAGETNERRISLSADENITDPDITPIASIGIIDKKVEIKYYKKEESVNSTKLYFLFNNRSDRVYTYYIERLAVNDKDIDVSKYKDTIYDGVKYVSVVEVPKKLLSSNKKLNISFIFQDSDKSIYKTVEKELQI